MDSIVKQEFIGNGVAAIFSYRLRLSDKSPHLERLRIMNGKKEMEFGLNETIKLRDFLISLDLGNQLKKETA